MTRSVLAKNLTLGLVLMMFAALIAACSGGNDQPDCDQDSLGNCVPILIPTPVPTMTAAPTQNVTGTPTATSTPTAAPTQTPKPTGTFAATPTPTAVPTQTPKPTGTSAVTPTPTATPTPPPPPACSGQGLIGIDPVNNVAYVPTGIADTSGNATVALVDLTPGVPKPLIKTLPLIGANLVPALAFNPNDNTMLAEGFAFKSFVVQIYEIDTTSQTVKNTVVATGLTKLGRGGILENATSNQGFVADDSDLGVLDTSKSPPVWDSASVVGTTCSDSLALNFVTGTLFISCDGTNEIIETTKSPLAPINFQGTGTGAFTDGVSFDTATNIAVLSAETGRDESFAFNFATLNTAVAPATADIVRVPGAGCTDPNTCNGETGIIGEGPGGQAAIDCATHQAVIVDELGQNLKLIQLPVAPVGGALNNNGQPGTGSKPDAASVFTISGTLLPSVGGFPLLADGDPNSLSVYAAQNFAYLRASGSGGKVLVGVDLSKPVLGASAAGCAAKKTCWNPATVVIPLQ